MKNNELESATLQVGDSLTVDSTIGTASVTVNDQPTDVIDTSTTFGPYDDVTVLTVRNVSGTTDLTRTRAKPSSSEQFARKYRATVPDGKRRAVTIPAGSRLVLTGDGYAYPAGTFQVYGVTTVEASTVPRVYIVVAGEGGLTLETGWASVPGGALRFSDGTPLQFSDGSYLELAA